MRALRGVPWRVRSSEGLGDEFVVLAMGADPEPMDATRDGQTECTVVQANSNTVEATVAYSLELQRWVRRIGFELSVAPVGEGLNVSG